MTWERRQKLLLFESLSAPTFTITTGQDFLPALAADSTTPLPSALACFALEAHDILSLCQAMVGVVIREMGPRCLTPWLAPPRLPLGCPTCLRLPTKVAPPKVLPQRFFNLCSPLQLCLCRVINITKYSSVIYYISFIVVLFRDGLRRVRAGSRRLQEIHRQASQRLPARCKSGTICSEGLYEPMTA